MSRGRFYDIARNAVGCALPGAFLLALPVLIRAQDAKPPVAPQQVQEPPEEDNSFKPRTYDFNPLKASQSITAGNFYFDKKNYNAAKNRYVDATLYDPAMVKPSRNWVRRKRS